MYKNNLKTKNNNLRKKTNLNFTGKYFYNTKTNYALILHYSLTVFYFYLSKRNWSLSTSTIHISSQN